MKKIAIISDLHIDTWINYTKYYRTINEFYNEYMKSINEQYPDVDAIVVAGDVWNGSFTEPYIDNKIIYVPGNHDYYNFKMPERPSYLIRDQYIGTTLWTDFNGRSNHRWIFDGIYDSSAIFNVSSQKLISFFNESFVTIGEHNKEIVITHFPPHQFSVEDKHIGDPFNAYFINNIGDMWFQEHDIKLWICGHTHWKHSYRVGDTLVVCNPAGYPGEIYTSFSYYKPMIVEKRDERWEVIE